MISDMEAYFSRRGPFNECGKRSSLRRSHSGIESRLRLLRAVIIRGTEGVDIRRLTMELSCGEDRLCALSRDYFGI